MRAYRNVNVSASRFRVLIDPRCSIGLIDVKNMVFTECVPVPFSCFYGPGMHLMRAHRNVNVCASPFRVPIELGRSTGPIDVENMVFTK